MIRITIRLLLLACPAFAQQPLQLTLREQAPKQLAAHAAAARPDWLSAPMLGYSITPHPLEVRALLGVPGATTYSEPFHLADGITRLIAAPRHAWLLAFTAGGQALAWKPEEALELPLAAVTAEPDLVAFSASGRAAAFLWKDTQRTVVYTGLPQAPVLAAEFAHAEWPTDLRRAVLSEDGTLLAASAKTGEVYLLAGLGRWMNRLVLESSSPAPALAISSDGSIVAADGAELRLVDHPVQGASARVVASLAALPRPGHPGLQMLANSDGEVHIADPGAGVLLSVNPLTGATRLQEAGGAAAQIETIRPQGLLRWTGASNEPARLLSTQAGEIHSLSYIPVPAPVAINEVIQ